MRTLLLLLYIACNLSLSSLAGDKTEVDILVQTAKEIRAEFDPQARIDGGRPLPLAGHWNKGTTKGREGYTPEKQYDLLKQGHHILPWFNLASPVENWDDANYYDVLKEFSKYKIPISLVSDQWERILTIDPKYKNLPKDINPNVLTDDGELLKKVSPFGNTDIWEQAGKDWTNRSVVKSLQKWYPDPPLVLFLSNNEHSKLLWTDYNLSSRYLKAYGTRKSGDEIRKIFGDHWIEKYRAFQKGMRQGLVNDVWKNRSIFVGYGAFGSSAFARWIGWKNYSLYTPGRMEPWPLAWDGASVPYYTHDWNSSTDFKVMSPQVQAMNWMFMLEDVYNENPNYWFELSIWDGYQPKKDTNKRKYYESLGQKYTPERYGGYIRFGLWLLKPRLVREFRNWTDSVEEMEPYFKQILRSVDEIYCNDILKKFWREGDVVKNLEMEHPYQVFVPNEFKNKKRWFLLNVDVNSQKPLNLDTEINVFSIALKLTIDEKDEWLVYTYSPLQSYEEISVDIPDYKTVLLMSSPKGNFYHVKSNDDVVIPVNSPSCLAEKQVSIPY